MILLAESDDTKSASRSKLATPRPKKSGLSLQQVSPRHRKNVFNPPSPLPPLYTPRNKPSRPVSYDFRPMPWSSMLLVPSENVGEAHEPYSISVTPNCFTPSSFITTVRRNTLDGEFVGSFEMGSSGAKVPSTVCLRGNEYPLNEALTIHPFRRNAWTWTTFDHDKPVTLHWEGKDILQCFRSKDKTLVAKFLQRTAPPREGRAIVHAKLELTPEGHDFFDDIIMSVLIVERLRTLPNI